jgi:hypothetical protein
VLDYLNRESSYGNKETRTGKALEGHFGGLGYGWEAEMVRLVMAVLFRAGAIDVTHNGRRHDSYSDPQSRIPFANNVGFRSALFTPAKPIDLPTLTKAVESFEGLSGGTVDVEKNAIAAAVKKWAEEEHKQTLQLQSDARANRLPVLAIIEDYQASLLKLMGGTAEECVVILAAEGKTLKDAKERVRDIRSALDEAGLAIIRQARVALEIMWPTLRSRSEDGEVAKSAESLQALMGSDGMCSSMKDIQAAGRLISARYESVYSERHSKRAKGYESAVEAIKGRPEWATVPEAMRAPILDPLFSRACSKTGINESSAVCAHCNASLGQLDSDIAAIDGIMAQVVAKILELTIPKEKLQRVKLSEFFDEVLDSEDAVQRAVERLREQLLKLIAEGARIVLE